MFSGSFDCLATSLLLAVIFGGQAAKRRSHLKCFYLFLLLGVFCLRQGHNLCSLTYIFVLFIFAPLSIRQYLNYIDNVGVKSFILVAIELHVFLFKFRCTVQVEIKFLWRKVKLTVANLLATVTDATNVTNVINNISPIANNLNHHTFYRC